MAAPMRGRIQTKTQQLSTLICRNFKGCQHKITPVIYRAMSSYHGDSNLGKSDRLLRPNGTKIAFNSVTGKAPGVVFCPGFQSSMGGAKALALQQFCQEKGHAFLRFDYQACGQSEGDIRKVTLSDWKSDVVAVLDELTRGPQVLIGSSMGAWLAVLAVKCRTERIHGLIGVASAPDFSLRTEKSLPQKSQDDLKTTGETLLDSQYGQYVITQQFVDDLQQHKILDGPEISAPFPVRLIHGMADCSVPYELTVRLSKKIDSPDLSVSLRKGGDHRLSEPKDIKVLLEQLDELLQYPSNDSKL